MQEAAADGGVKWQGVAASRLAKRFCAGSTAVGCVESCDKIAQGSQGCLPWMTEVPASLRDQ